MEAEALALLIAGIVASPIITFFKNRAGLSGVPALWFAYALTAVIAGVAILATGGFAALPSFGDPVTFVEFALLQAGAVFALATLVYRSLKT